MNALQVVHSWGKRLYKQPENCQHEGLRPHMEKHPQITIARIRHLLDELRQQFWVDPRPLHVSVFRCAEPIAYVAAVQQEFTTIEPGFSWGPQWSTAWFHLTGDYPAEWAGRTVVALIDTGSEALVWVNGAPAQGLDANRRDFVLTADDGHVDIYVEAAGNHAFGTGGLTAEQPFTFARANLACFNAPVWEFYHDLRVLFELVTQLPAASARHAKLLAALNDAVNAYRRGGVKAISAARAALAAEYARPACSSAGTVNALGHAHIDTAWLWPLRETVRKCARTFSTVLATWRSIRSSTTCRANPSSTRSLKRSILNSIRASNKPWRRVAGNRRGPCGWRRTAISPPENRWCGRSSTAPGFSVRNSGWKIRSSGCPIPSAFPPRYRKSYARRVSRISCHQRSAGMQTNPFPHHTFTWEGIDGSQVLAHFLPLNSYNGTLAPAELLRGEQRFNDKARADGWLDLYGYGDGGGGPVKETLETYRRARNLEGLPKLTQEGAGDWFPKMASTARELATWVGELYLELHRGTYTTQAKNKWENRRCEFLLHDAEFLAAIHPGAADDYPAAALEEAWKLVLLNQFHDILPGSSIPWVYQDSARDYIRVHEIADVVISKSISAFTAVVDTSKLTNPLMVWNTLSFARSGLVSLPWQGSQDMVVLSPGGQPSRTQITEEDGERRLLVEILDVPAMGYLTVDLLEGAMPEEVIPAVTDEVHAGEVDPGK